MGQCNAVWCSLINLPSNRVVPPCWYTPSTFTPYSLDSTMQEIRQYLVGNGTVADQCLNAYCITELCAMERYSESFGMSDRRILRPTADDRAKWVEAGVTIPTDRLSYLAASANLISGATLEEMFNTDGVSIEDANRLLMYKPWIHTGKWKFDKLAGIALCYAYKLKVKAR